MPAPDAQAPKRRGVSAFDTNALLTKAETLVNAWKFDDAVKCIEEVLARYPGDPELTALQIYYRYLKSRNAGGNKSNGLVQRTLRDVQRVCGGAALGVAGNLVQGQLQKFLGRRDLATEHFKQVLTIDPKNVEAFRELQNLGVIARGPGRVQ